MKVIMSALIILFLLSNPLLLIFLLIIAVLWNWFEEHFITKKTLIEKHNSFSPIYNTNNNQIQEKRRYNNRDEKEYNKLDYLISRYTYRENIYSSNSEQIKKNKKEMEAELKEISRSLAKKYWNLEFDLDIRIHSSHKKLLGQFVFSYLEDTKGITKYTPKYIYISKKLILTKNTEEILSTLKHELCHWALCIQGKNFKDGDSEFELELIKIGSSSTGTTNPY